MKVIKVEPNEVFKVVISKNGIDYCSNNYYFDDDSEIQFKNGHIEFKLDKALKINTNIVKQLNELE